MLGKKTLGFAQLDYDFTFTPWTSLLLMSAFLLVLFLFFFGYFKTAAILTDFCFVSSTESCFQTIVTEYSKKIFLP